MPQFKYSAVGAGGQQVKGEAEAMSLAALENELLLAGHSGIKVSERKAWTQIEITKQRVPAQSVMHFSRQLAAFARTGIPINEAIRIVGEGVENKRFQAIVFDIEEALNGGTPLSDAVAAHQAVFPPYYVSVLRSAEQTGRLDEVLDQLAEYIERDEDARAQVKSALMYPSVIMGMAVVVVLVMVLFVLPRFVDFFDELNAELPLPTRMLLGFTDFIGTWFWLIGIVVALLSTAWVLFVRTDSGMYFKHSLALRIPLIGQIVEYSVVERFCRVFGATMKAGVPMTDAMQASIESANNRVFQRELEMARDAMIQGDGIAGPIARTALFPIAAVQMIRVGEETGTLDDQMVASADFFGRELEYKLKKLTTLFEPFVILLMGGIVGFVAVALISAMYGIFNGAELSE